MSLTDDLNYSIVTWDWKEQIPFDEILKLQDEGLLYLAPVEDTGSDSYAAVLACVKINAADAQQIWNEVEADLAGERAQPDDLTAAADAIELFAGIDEGENTDYDALMSLAARLRAASPTEKEV